MNRLFVLLAVLLVAGVFSAHSQSAEEQYVRIYNLIQQADALNGNGQFALALPKYLEAQSALQRIQKFNPEWNPKVVNYRLGYLADRIEAGASPVVSAPKTAPPAVTPSPATPVTKPETQPTTPPQPTPALTDLQNHIARLQSDKAILEAKLKEALATQPAAVDPRELARAQEQIQSLSKENELLKTNLESGKAGPKTATETKEVEDLKSALAESNRKLAEQTAVAEKSVGENNSLLVRVNQLVATAAATEALRAENVILKQQLTQAQTTNAVVTQEANRIATEAEARIAALQSDMQLVRLEKNALENRLKRSPVTPPLPVMMPPRRDVDAQRIRQLEQDRSNLQKELATATNTAPALSGQELVAKVDQLTKEVTGLRARVEIFEARAIPYTPEELALFQTTKPKVAAADPVFEQKVVRALPAGVAALVAEAQRNFAVKDYDKAEANYQEILRQDEKNPTALANLATIQMEAGRLDDADKTIQQALAAQPNDGYNLATLGKVKYQQEKYDEALDALSRAAKAVPQNAEIQNYLGVTLSQKGQRGPAETALRKAIQIDSSYSSAHNNLAVIYATQTPPLIELARWHYQKALAAGHPKNAELEKLFDKKEAAAK